jgi:hypothetical protein
MRGEMREVIGGQSLVTANAFQQTRMVGGFDSAKVSPADHGGFRLPIMEGFACRSWRGAAL